MLFKSIATKLVGIIATIAIVFTLAPLSLAAGKNPYTPILNTTVVNGQLSQIGNTLMECDKTNALCVQSLPYAKDPGNCGGTGSYPTCGNDSFFMKGVNVDPVPASVGVQKSPNSSSANLVIPAGMKVKTAYAFWGGTWGGGCADLQSIASCGTAAGTYAADAGGQETFGYIKAGSGIYNKIKGDTSYHLDSQARGYYNNSKDVTSIVDGLTAGTHKISMGAQVNGNDYLGAFGGWSLLTILEKIDQTAFCDPTKPAPSLKTVTIMDGFALTSDTGFDTADAKVQIDVKFEGFKIPAGGGAGTKIYMAALDGDPDYNLDKFTYGGLNGADFGVNRELGGDAGKNTMRSLISSGSDSGRLPNNKNTMGFDLLDINTGTAGATILPAGATSFNSRFTAKDAADAPNDSDRYAPMYAALETPTDAPALCVKKTAYRADGTTVAPNGSNVQTDEIITYKMEVVNNGTFKAIKQITRDVIPTGTVYVPGSLKYDGATQTDATSDDRMSYLAGGTVVNVTPPSGDLNVKEKYTAEFKVKVTATSGKIDNQFFSDYNDPNQPTAPAVKVPSNITTHPIIKAKPQMDVTKRVIADDELVAGTAVTTCTDPAKFITFDDIKYNGTNPTDPLVGLTPVLENSVTNQTNCQLVKPSTKLTYEIKVKNTGTVKAANVQVIDAIPVGTTYVAESARMKKVLATPVKTTPTFPGETDFFDADDAGSNDEISKSTIGTGTSPLQTWATNNSIPTTNPTIICIAGRNTQDATSKPFYFPQELAAGDELICRYDVTVNAALAVNPITEIKNFAVVNYIDTSDTSLNTGADPTKFCTPTLINNCPNYQSTTNTVINKIQAGATIGDFVWDDYNANGIQDINELPLEGVAVTLKKNGAIIPGVDPILTDIDGKYLFTNIESVPADVFTVEFGGAPLDLYRPTKVETVSGATGSDVVFGTAGPYVSKPFSLPTATTINLDIDAGFVAEPIVEIVKSAIPASGTTVKLNDEIEYTLEVGNNGLGIAKDVIVADKVPACTTFVSATDGGVLTAGNVVWPAVDELDSFFLFTVTFIVKVTDVTSAACTKVVNVGEIQSHINPFKNPLVAQPSIPSNIIEHPIVKPPAIIGNFIWEDINGNGIQDAAEPGVAGVKVQVFNGATLINTATTDSTGKYSIEVPAGTYTVKFIAPTDAVFTQTGKGTVATDSNPDTTGVTPSITVTAGQTDDSIDAGIVYPPKLAIVKTSVPLPIPDAAGTVKPGTDITYILEITNTGKGQALDVAVSDAVPANMTFKSVPTTNSGAQAAGKVTWTIPDIQPNGGKATVTFVATVVDPTLDGTEIINKAEITGYKDPSLPAPVTTPIPSNEVKHVVLGDPATIGDLVFEDINGNGIQDAGEPGIDGVTVTLKKAGVAVGTPVVTAGGGKYSFTVPAGTYSLEFTTPTGAVITTKDSATGTDTTDSDIDVTGKIPTVTVAAKEINNSFDAGFVYPPKLAIKKSANPATGTTVNPASDITYSLEVENTGTGSAYGIVVKDAVPAGTTFKTSVDGGILTGTDVVFPKFDLAKTAKKIVTFVITVNSPATVSKIDNIANITEFTDPTKPATPNTTPIPSNPTSHPLPATELTIIKGANPAPDTVVKPGQVITYTLEIKNASPTASNNIVVEDLVPTGTTYVAGSADNAGTEAAGTVKWTLANLAAGLSKTVSYQAKVNKNPGLTEIKNTAQIKSYEDPANPGVPKGPVTSNEVKHRLKSPKLEIVKDSTPAKDTVVTPGTEITYTIKVKNTGEGTAVNVIVDDTVPAGTTYVTASASTGGAEASGVVTWAAVDIEALQEVTYTFKVKVNTVPSTTTIKNIANIKSYEDPTKGPTPQPAIPSNEVKHTLEAPLLKITKGANPAPGTVVNPNQEITYTLEVENTGKGQANSVIVEDAVPTDTTYVAASADNAGVEATGIVTWNLGDVAAGAKKTLSYKAKVIATPAGSSIKNTAMIKSFIDPTVSPDPRPSIPSNEVVHPLGGPSLTITKSSIVPADTEVNPGEVITYKLTIKNTSAGIANDIIVEDKVPTGTTYVAASADNAGIEASGTVTWTIATLAGNSEKVVSFQATVNKVPGVNPIKNIGQIKTFKDPTKPNEVQPPIPSNEIKHPLAAPKLTIVKSAMVPADTAVNPGDVITYSLKITNSGKGIAMNVVVDDTVPTGTTYVATSADNAGVEASGVVTWNLGDLIGGAMKTVSFKAMVVAAPTVNPIKNIGQIKKYDDPSKPGETIPPIPSNEIKHPIASPKLSIVKSVNPTTGTPVNRGQELTYTLTIKNAGPGNATDVMVSDMVPEGTTYVDSSADNGGTQTAGKINWTLGNLLKETMKVVTFKVIVKSDISINSVKNVAFISSYGDPSKPGISNPPIESNPVVNPIAPLPITPRTGASQSMAIIMLMIMAMAVLVMRVRKNS